MNQQELEFVVQALHERVAYLESILHDLQTSKLPRLKSVHYHINTLHVRDLSGTLNIGITSIGNETDLTDFHELPDVVTHEEPDVVDEDVDWDFDSNENLSRD